MIIRQAKPSEDKLLSQLAFESKSYWPYDEEYLTAAREHIQITNEQIIRDHVYVCENGEDINGFYHFHYSGDASELVWFFVHPSSIGTGIGNILWNHVIKLIRELDIKEFIIKSDPNAESFYIKYGARRIGWKPSSVDAELSLPLLEYVDGGV
jgi:N-acetylglutamate synthase-like GNAT family acetyltransferase